VLLKRAILALALVWGACSLPLHGQDERVFSRMDLLDNTYKITINDRLLYQVIEEQSPPAILVLDKEGKVRFPPLSESLLVVGRSCYEVAHELKALLEVDFFYRATVDIKVAESTFREKVTVYGQIRNQGIVNLPKDGFMTISQVINQAGGFLEGADLETVAIQRKDPENPEKDQQLTVNMAEILNQGKIENDIRVFGDDVIIVNKLEEVGGRYSVLGAVRNPGLFTISQNRLTVSEAILLAGGFTEVARETRVRLTRRIPDSNESETYWINVRRILQEGDRNEDMLVKENDIINVSERIIVF
jgi:protein involved in polysaccharide export with SLBB domain